MSAAVPWKPLVDAASASHGVISRRRASELGVNANAIARALRLGLLREPLPGVLVIGGAAPSWRQQLMIATLGSAGAAVAGFRAAAALHRLAGYAEGPMEVVATSWRRSVASVARVHTGPLEPCDLSVIDAVRCTTVARTLCDVAGVDGADRVRWALASALHRGARLDDIAGVARRLHRPGQRGTGALLRILDAW